MEEPMRTYCRLLGPDHRGRHKACVYSDHRTPTANAICGSRARADSTHGATGQRLSRFVLVRDPRHAHQSHPDAALIIVMATGAQASLRTKVNTTTRLEAIGTSRQRSIGRHLPGLPITRQYAFSLSTQYA